MYAPPVQQSPAVQYRIYVRTTGSDTTGTGSALLPYRTPLRALQDVPRLIAHDVRYIIDCTGLGTYELPDGYTLPDFVTEHLIVYDPVPLYSLFSARGAVTFEADSTVLEVIPPGEIVSVTGDPTTGL